MGQRGQDGTVETNPLSTSHKSQSTSALAASHAVIQ
jgi:hypothetical protein